MAGEHVPVVDIGKISLVSVDVPLRHYDEVGRDFCAALSTWGFAYLKNHGIPRKTVSDCVSESKKFFELSRDAKLKHSRGTQSINGYSEVGREVLDDDEVIECKESLDVSSFDSSFPAEIPRLKGKCQSLVRQSIILSRRLLRCMAMDLGADQQDFLHNHSKMFSSGGGNATCLRILRYPAADFGQGLRSQTRCGAHTDYGGLTLLFQDSSGGLEIQDLEGKWIEVKPMEDTIVVNLGDLMSFWSGDRYKATKHRVVFTEGNSGNDRYSMAFFVHPNHDTKLIPFGTDDDGSSPHLTAREHVEHRFAGTYRK